MNFSINLIDLSFSLSFLLYIILNKLKNSFIALFLSSKELDVCSNKKSM